MKNRYLQDKKTGQLMGSVPSPVEAPDTNDLVKTRALSKNLEEDNVSDVKTDYSALSEAMKNLHSENPEQEERRRGIVSWASNVPENSYALDKYFEIISNELDTDTEDIKFRYQLLKDSASTGADISGEPDLEYTRFVVQDPKRKLVGTPKDEASCRAISDLETLAGEKRREKRSLVETVDEEGTVWVRYTNNRFSEILRAVNYNEETRELTVQLAKKPTDTDEANTVEYKYQNVNPTIVKQLVSARSMGRFYNYVFRSHRNNSNMGNLPLKEYSFISQYSNFMWPTTPGSRGPVPSQKTLDKAKTSLSTDE